MSIEFAEKVLDGMVDENGHCGERGLSAKQFDILSEHLVCDGCKDAGGWSGDYAYRQFTSTDYEGDIGKYHVKLNEYFHFHRRCTVTSIDLRPAEEYEAYLARKAREAELREIAKFEHSEWRHEPKERVDLELTLVRESSYERESYWRWNATDTVYIHTFADAEGNCYVWKTQNPVMFERWDGDDLVEETYAEPGDKVAMRATVKEHSEYRGIKQTVINRPKVKAIERWGR